MKMKDLLVLMLLMIGSTLACDSLSGFDSCKGLYEAGVRCNGAYKIGRSKAYCHMEYINGCGAGPWTLVMKIDGKKQTFHYNSSYWENTLEFQPQNGLKFFDDSETKLSTYYRTPFKKICLGMKQERKLRFLALPVSAYSLHSLIADRKFRKTDVTKSSWLGLLKNGQLQNNCNQQGFNVYDYVRIGIRSNQENDCDTCDSWIGFGAWIGNTCGNFANAKWVEKGKKGANEKVTGYILVQ